MSYEITGTLIEKYPAVDVSGKFRKREFVISKNEISNGFDFTDYIKFQLTQDRCNLIEQYSTGDLIKVSFNLRGRKWEKDGSISYFTNLEAWKIEKITAINTDTPMSKTDLQNNPVPLPDENDFTSPVNYQDDLPF